MNTIATQFVPDGWEEVSVDNLGEVVAGGTPSRNNSSYWNGDIPWVTPGEITQLQSKYLCQTEERITAAGLAGSAARLLPEKSIVVTTRATLGEAAITACPLATNQGFKNIVPNLSSDPLFTYYKIKTLRGEMERLASGTTFLEISKADFERIRLSRPIVAEQERIARILDTIDKAIEHTDAFITKLKHVQSGLLNELLTRGIDENGNIRVAQRADEFVATPIGRLPRSWTIDKLIATAARTENSFNDGDWIEAPHIRSEGIRLVQTGNIGIGKYLDKSDDKKFISQASFAALRCKPILPGDILICRLADPVGRACIVPDNLRSAITSVDVTIYRPDANRLVNSFIVRWLNTHGMLLRCSLLAAGTTRLRISRSNLGAMLVPVPSIDEQNEIARILDSADADIEAAERTQSKLCQLKIGLTDDLLSGRVRVQTELEMA